MGFDKMKLQRRMAAKIKKCGLKRIWFDPAEKNEISMANTHRAVRKLLKDGLIIRKAVRGRRRARLRRTLLAKRKGRHNGIGKRKGTKDARMPAKLLWMRRQRALRRVLRKYRAQKKLDKHLYRYFYLQAKGNNYRNKRNMMEAIWRKLAEDKKIKALEEERRALDAMRRERKAAREAKEARRLAKEA